MKTITYDETKWKLMPVSINEDMHVAAVRTIARCSGNDDFPRRVYDAMSIAAPLPPEVKPISVPEPTARELDMAALVKRLARQVRRAEPYGTNYHKLSDDALDALKRWGLDGSPMRSTPPAVEQAVHDVLSDVVTRGIGIMRIDPTQIYQHTPPAVEQAITVTESGGVQLNTSSPEVINKLWALVDQFRDARKEQP